MQKKDKTLSRKVFQTINPQQLANLKALRNKIFKNGKQNLAESNKENINNRPYIAQPSLSLARKDRKGHEEYLDNIEEHLKDTCTSNLASFDAFDHQTEINRRMRGILFNWLIEVQVKLSLKEKTIFIAANIFDRYLQYKQISREKLQLTGITCFLIASKYEDIYPPEIRELYQYCDKIYEPNEFLECESEIISCLDFNFVFVSAIDFNELYFKQHCDNKELSKKFKNASTLILEIFLFDSFVGGYDSQKLAAFSRLIGRKLVGFEKNRREELTYDEYAAFTESMTNILTILKKDKLHALETKYKSLFLKLLYSDLN